MPQASLLIVIVNYRTAPLVLDCLRSLAVETARWTGSIRVVVTDNASGDDSVATIRGAIAAERWQGWCELLSLERNGGYAHGNNAAIAPALAAGAPPAYVWLLNPDTIVRPGALQELVRFMDEDPQVGIAGSRLEYPDGTPQQSAFRFHSLASEIESGLRFGPASRLLQRWVVAPPVSDVACRTDWVAGASMMIRREVFERIGLLDEGYFLYYEDVDFCRRAASAGWACGYVPASRVVHLVGRASGVTGNDRARRRRPAYWFEARRRYFLEHHGRLYLLLADAVWIAAFTLWRLRRALTGKPDADPPALLGDSIYHSSLNPFRRRSRL